MQDLWRFLVHNLKQLGKYMNLMYLPAALQQGFQKIMYHL